MRSAGVCALSLRFRFACPVRAALVFLLVLLVPPIASAQVRPDSSGRSDTPGRPAVISLGDSLRVDTSGVAVGDTARAATGQGRLSRPIDFKAARRISIRFDSTGADGERVGDIARLEQSAEVTYGNQKLEAATVELLFDRDELRAEGLPVDTGLVGRPKLTQGTDVVESERLFFNLRTERGRFLLARTRFEDGFIRARQVKIGPDSTLYVRGGVFTTCPCVDDPSYSLRAERMKVVDGKTVYTGPIQLYLFNIPTFLVLPFGLLPTTEGRRSGFLPPTYGEDTYGFYLRGLGWYWSISPYLDAQLTGGLWSKGSFQVTPRLRYARRYRYTGSVELDYARTRTGEPTDPDYTVVPATRLAWTHSQTFAPTTSLSANVNLSTTGYQRSFSETLAQRVSQSATSTVNFSTSWPKAGRSLSTSLNATTNFVNGAGQLTLPSLSFSQSNRQPFKRRNAPSSARARWYESFNYSLSSTVLNSFAFTPLPQDTLLKYDPDAATFAWYDALVAPSKYRRASGATTGTGFDFRAEHALPIGLSFTLERFRTTVSASAAYNETWLLATERLVADTASAAGTLRQRVDGFFAYRRANASISATSTAYGLFPLRIGRLDGLRHTLRPSVGMAFSPDYQADVFGYMRTVTLGDGTTRRYSIVPGATPSPATAAVTLGLDNVFEMRIRREDSTGVVSRTPLQLLSLGLNTAYNAVADSFRLAPVSFSARTSLFNRLEVNASGSLSPYRVSGDGTRLVDRLALGYDGGLVLPRLSSFNVSASTRFSGGRRGDPRPTQRQSFAAFVPGALPGTPLEGLPGGGAPVGPMIGAAPYADFSIPWSLSLTATYSSFAPLAVVTRTFTVGSTFDLNLTPRWKVQGTTGLDLVARAISTTNLAVLRDFDCWEMSFSWVPFGAYQSYGFNLQVKSGKLRELLRIQQPRQDARTRLGGLLR